MSAFFPRDVAVDFHAACAKWRPGTHSGALFNLMHALPQWAEAQYLLANGWAAVIRNCAQDLQGGMHPNFIHALNGLHALNVKASQIANGLPTEFAKLHAEPIRRAQTAGGHTANVPVGGRM